MDVQQGLRTIAHGGEAGIAEDETELVFTLRTETAMAFGASRESGTLEAFLNLNFGMNFKTDHKTPSQVSGTTIASVACEIGLQRKELRSLKGRRLGDLAQGRPENRA